MTSCSSFLHKKVEKESIFLLVSKIILNFATVFTSEAEVKAEADGGGDTYIEKVST